MRHGKTVCALKWQRRRQKHQIFFVTTDRRDCFEKTVEQMYASMGIIKHAKIPSVQNIRM